MSLLVLALNTSIDFPMFEAAARRSAIMSGTRADLPGKYGKPGGGWQPNRSNPGSGAWDGGRIAAS
jgi:hypothetical protein